jgi:eukaryotic-like serine/threonine-protein kinase
MSDNDNTLRSDGEIVVPASVAVGQVLAGKYRLSRFLGQGGMGTVFAAEQTELDVPVALKVMHAHIAAQHEYVERFRREARAAMLLKHENVIRVLDFGQHEGTFFLVMEYLDGIALDHWLAGFSAPPPLVEVVPIALDVLAALGAAHERGIVHRDLKPENVILVRGRAKVLDFGLAHVEAPSDATLTRPESVAGTPAYMSPEQSRSLKVGPAADLYAFGCLLTELLQLAPPFEAASAVETISQHLFIPPPPLARPEGAERVPPLLDKLRLELLAKHPHRRPPDAAAVRHRIEEAMDPEASAKRLPSRKGELPAGSRDERVPAWNDTASSASAVEQGDTRVLLLAAKGSPLHDQALVTGLCAQGFQPLRAHSLAEAEALAAAVAVADAGSDLEAALAWLAAKDAALPVVVVLAGLDAGKMRRLIEAGAADVATPPLAPDSLAKKLRRLARKSRRS